MYYVFAEEELSLATRDRHEQAAAHNRVARLRAVRRWDKRAADAARRARAARSAVL